MLQGEKAESLLDAPWMVGSPVGEEEQEGPRTPSSEITQ